jgi:hypothetical protein
MEQEENKKEGEHYVCTCGCQGVSDKPGTCQTSDCIGRGVPLDKCDCTNEQHNDFRPK